jgi:hypothetical protein
MVMLGLSLMWRRGFAAARFEAGAVVVVVGATALLATLSPPA